MRQTRHARVKAGLGTALACCLCYAASAWAQNKPVQQGAAAQDPPSSSFILQPVVVTAEKVAENLEKTPLAVTAITGSQILNLGISSTEALSDIAPNLMAAPNSDGSTVAIRGIVSTSQVLAGNSEVSYSEDGVPLIQKIDAFQGMYDVQRIEVLRGPQGTLYGANANAGAINVITNKPGLGAFGGYGILGFGNYDQMSAQGALNLPLSDSLAVRFAVDHEYHSGYVHLSNNGGSFDDQDFDGGRAQLLWKPSGEFSALLTFEDDHDGGAGDGGAGSGAPLGLYATEQGVSPYTYASMPARPSQDLSIRSTTLHLDWSLPFADVAYIGNVRWMYWNQAMPETIYGPDATYCQNAVNPTQCFNPLDEILYDRQTSDEVRFGNGVSSTGPLRWLTGFYHMREDNKELHQYDPDPSNKLLWEDAVTDGYFYESDAVYGQLTWNITQKLNLVGGLRYTRDSKGFPYGAQLLAPPGDIINNLCVDCRVAATFNGRGEWRKAQWHGGINYDLSARSFLFASVATGYEAGGFSTSEVEPFNPVYGPENLTNYEIGWKYQSNRAEVNVDGFLMHYTGYQVTSSIIQSTGQYLAVVLNSGVANIKGIELESKFLLTPRDQLDFDATGLRSVFTQFYLPLGDGYVTVPGGKAPTDYTGNVLPNAPASTLRLGYQHTFALGGNMVLVPRIDSFYSTMYWLDYHDFDAVSQKAYTRTDASLILEDVLGDKTFTTQLYVRNIENTAVLAGGQGDANAPGHDFNEYGKNGYYLPPRTYGVEFTVSF